MDTEHARTKTKRNGKKSIHSNAYSRSHSMVIEQRKSASVHGIIGTIRRAFEAGSTRVRLFHVRIEPKM